MELGVGIDDVLVIKGECWKYGIVCYKRNYEIDLYFKVIIIVLEI